MRVLITGSSGLIGSEVCRYLGQRDHGIDGIDNNQRAAFFGPAGDTSWNTARLNEELDSFTHHDIDIRDRETILALVERLRPEVIVHAAAQPSHDLAAEIPFDDFDINAGGTLNLLEATRRFVPRATFVYFSTNKVYGYTPNRVPMREAETRWEFADARFKSGIDETMSIDQSKHSLFGASKVAADIAVQEYGRYFDMNTCCLRGGCLTGSGHSGVESHGFLSYLVKCNLAGERYTIFGYKGKQVRDNIHSRDVARFVEAFMESPSVGAVYNIGGGKPNSCSIIEAFRLTEGISGRKMKSTYSPQNRAGDHICYYTDLSRITSEYPEWDVSVSLEEIIQELVEAWRKRLAI